MVGWLNIYHYFLPVVITLAIFVTGMRKKLPRETCVSCPIVYFCFLCFIYATTNIILTFFFVQIQTNKV